ncbi:tyrosine-protein phosphatase [Pseudomonas sp. W03]|uniref:tyrosine-protein phosphatase n=1 Tax=Pseudomonas sp. W03 TaxID=3090666 RepID=UPI003A4D2C94
MAKRLLIPAALLCLPHTTALALDLSLDTPRLVGADNFRDVAGTTQADVTANGGVMRSGVFYRSNALTLKGNDKAILEGLGIGEIFDLRTPGEIAQAPDVLPAGARYQNINIIGGEQVNPPLTSPEAAREWMRDLNRDFVTDAGQRARYHDLFMELASAEDPVIFHCTSGKDRTGWTAAMLQSIAGVDSATIMQDYLATNSYSAGSISATLAKLSSRAPALASVYAPLLGVEESYLQAGLDQITQDYGTVDNYLKEGLGLDQETIYVLRGKMVRFGSLPGQAGLAGNAAAGAGLLAALQDSDLSGRYSAYNYYLQSAIDAGSLGGLEQRVGGQIHADSASYLLRQTQLIDNAIAPYASGRDLREGESQLWMSALASYVGTDGSSHASSSNEHSQGALVGLTHRFDSQTSARAGFGYSNGDVASSGASADADLTFITLGGRYAFDSLEQGAYADLRLDAGYIDYDSRRDLGYGLGRAKGDTQGSLYSALANLGYRTHNGDLTLEPTLGVRVSQVRLDGFTEKGSELALDVDTVDKTVTSLVGGLNLGFGQSHVGDWSLQPGLNLGYEHAFGNPEVKSHGAVQGFGVEQVSAFNDRDLFKVGAGLTARAGAVSVSADVQGLQGSDSHGLSGNLSLGIAF